MAVLGEGGRKGDDRIYAGIGPRATPPATLERIEVTARRLARAGWALRTGMSPGADQAFYAGAVAGCGLIELYLPWPVFEAHARLAGEGRRVFTLPEPTSGAYEMAARFDPGWSALPARARHLLARDVHQVLGEDLVSPVAFVLCWTPDGDLDGTGARSGGTGQALRIAAHHEIAVLNLARPDHARPLSRFAAGLSRCG